MTLKRAAIITPVKDVCLIETPAPVKASTERVAPAEPVADAVAFELPYGALYPELT